MVQKLGADVEVGPYSIVGAEVSLGGGVRLHSHVVVGGRTTIGPGTEIFPSHPSAWRPRT